jgi:predicted metal-dependent RNase
MQGQLVQDEVKRESRTDHTALKTRTCEFHCEQQKPYLPVQAHKETISRMSRIEMSWVVGAVRTPGNENQGQGALP